jgi:FAD/FMN-containing dehydrogenase
MVLEHFPSMRFPLEKEYPFYVLVETSGSSKDHDYSKLESFLEKAIENGDIGDGTLAQDTTQLLNIWKIRETIPEACSKHGAVYKYDISLPANKMYEIVDIMRDRLGEKAVDVIGYGHFGDGNLHLNISTAGFSKEITDLIEPFIYQYVQEHRGSISAEHGLGAMKPQFIYYSKSYEMVNFMKSIKDLFDPEGIMNPYKLLPE